MKKHKLTIYGKLCRNVTIFYRQELGFFILSAAKLERVQEFKIKLFK